MYQYSESFEFDMMVVLFVLVVMPLSVALMQSKKPIARLVSFALLIISILYVGGFEHYRLHRPEVTKGGLKQALVPSALLELLQEPDFEVSYLPVAGTGSDISAMEAELEKATDAEGAAGAAKEGVLKVHLAHKDVGDAFFRSVMQALEKATCPPSEPSGRRSLARMTREVPSVTLSTSRHMAESASGAIRTGSGRLTETVSMLPLAMTSQSCRTSSSPQPTPL